MQWEDARRSDNIEDDRGGGGGGGGFGIPIGGGGLGIGAIIVLTLIGFATGIDPRILIGGAGFNDPRIAALPGKDADGVMTFFPFDMRYFENAFPMPPPPSVTRAHLKSMFFEAIFLVWWKQVQVVQEPKYLFNKN